MKKNFFHKTYNKVSFLNEKKLLDFLIIDKNIYYLLPQQMKKILFDIFTSYLKKIKPTKPGLKIFDAGIV